MDPSLCVNGCGFFGSSGTKKMCSKCYKDHILQLNKSITESISLLDINKSIIESISHNLQDLKISEAKKVTESATTTGINNITRQPSFAPKDAKKRCKSCNKKVGLTGFKCKCGDMFCGKHRYPEEHSCVVDFKYIGRELLRKQNPLCQADKLHYRL